jgi:predicted DNA-binding transcriptional regulator YafY
LEHDPHLGPYLQRKEEGDGLLSIHLRPEEYDWLVRVLLSLGTDTTILAPEELRQRLQQQIQEIACHYSKI